MSARIALLMVALMVAPGCRRKERLPDVEEQLPRASAVREEVIRGPSSVEVRPELIPLETRPGYVPAEGQPVPGARKQAEEALQASARGTVRREDPVALKRALDQVSERSSCNSVMGCPAERELLKAGPVAVRPIIERYAKLERPGFQKFHLIELLGRIGDPAAIPFLVERLGDPHWQARTHAAMALGRMRAKDELNRLKELLEGTGTGGDAGFRYGLAFAVEKLSGEGGRQILLDAVSSSRVAGTNWGYTRIAVEALAELGATEACPNLPACIEHNDVFLKKESIRAVALLGCREEPVLAAVAAQLDSRIPSVRRGARETLQKLTGIQFSSRTQFEMSREKRQ